MHKHRIEFSPRIRHYVSRKNNKIFDFIKVLVIFQMCNQVWFLLLCPFLGLIIKIYPKKREKWNWIIDCATRTRFCNMTLIFINSWMPELQKLRSHNNCHDISLTRLVWLHVDACILRRWAIITILKPIYHSLANRRSL